MEPTGKSGKVWHLELTISNLILIFLAPADSPPTAHDELDTAE
jgi:hypothetical protein